MNEENPPTTLENLPEDLRVLLKVTYHLCNKAYLENGRYSVPYREFERLRSKSDRLQSLIHRSKGE